MPTVESFKKYAIEKFEEVPEKTKNFFYYFFKNQNNTFVKVLRILLGIIIWATFQVMVFTVSIVFIVLFSGVVGDFTVQMDSVTSQVFTDFVVNPNSWIPFFALYFLIIIPLIFGIKIGSYLLFNGKSFNRSIVGMLLFIWLLSLSYIGMYSSSHNNSLKDIQNRYETAILKNPDYHFYIEVNDDSL